MPIVIIIIISFFVITGLVLFLMTSQKKKYVLEIEQAIKDLNYDQAMKLIETGAKSQLSPFQKRFYTAEVLEGKGEFTQAIESYEKSLLQLSASNYKLSFEIREKIASLCYEAGMVDKALGYYELILQTHKDHQEALLNTADIYIGLNNFSRAKIQLERLLSGNATDFKAHIKLVNVMVKLNQYMEAGKHLRYIINHNDASEVIKLEARELLGENFIQQKNYIEAVDTFEYLLSDDVILGNHPRMIKALENLLFSLVMQREIDAALTTYNTFCVGLKENEVNEVKYNMAHAMMRVGYTYRGILLIHSIHKDHPKFRDTAETVEKYALVLEAPYLAKVFSDDVIAVERYVSEVLHFSRDVQVIENPNFLLFIDSEHSNIVCRDLTPLTFEDCQTSAQLLISNKASRSRIRYYCFEALHDQDREIFAFNSFEQITGKEYVESLHPQNAAKTDAK